MASSDWPDYTHGVVLTDGTVTDCPDWQEQVVGPGGVPVGGGGITVLGAAAGPASPVSLTGGGTANVAAVTCSNTAPGYAMLSFEFEVIWASATRNAAQVATVTGDLTTTGTPAGLTPVSLDGAQASSGTTAWWPTWSGLVYLSQAAAALTLVLQFELLLTGSNYSALASNAYALMIWTP